MVRFGKEQVADVMQKFYFFGIDIRLESATPIGYIGYLGNFDSGYRTYMYHYPEEWDFALLSDAVSDIAYQAYQHADNDEYNTWYESLEQNVIIPENSRIGKLQYKKDLPELDNIEFNYSNVIGKPAAFIEKDEEKDDDELWFKLDLN